MLTISLLLAVFLGALVSGWHCALMCGGIAAAIESQGEGHGATYAPLQSKSQLFYLQLIMHFGRLTTYVLLGAIAARAGMLVYSSTLSEMCVSTGATISGYARLKDAAACQ